MEFTAPMPVTTCIARLQRLHEGGHVLAPDWLMRTAVDIERMNGSGTRFTVRRMTKNLLLGRLLTITRIDGTLQARDSNHTDVSATLRLFTVWAIVLGFLTLVLLPFIIFGLALPTVLDGGPLFFLLFIGVLAADVLVYIFYFILHQRRRLLEDFNHALRRDPLREAVA
jgi:hypothetical protein